MAEVKVNGIEYINFENEHSNNLISAISKIYYVFYDVDLQKDSFIKFHASKLVSDFTDRFTSSHDCLQAIPKALFVPEHQKMVADFYETATWPERLKDKDIVYLDASGIQTGWNRTNLIVAARDEKGIPTHVFVAIQNVNDVKLKEIAQQEQVIDQLEEIKSLNIQLEDNQAELEAQVEEITALNAQLEDNQAELEASMVEQEAQLQEINDLNSEMLLVLKSMADTYYSMHLINLIDDTVIDYKAKNEVKDIVNHYQGAVQMMVNVMKATVTDEYLEAVLNFADLTTLRERMRNDKVITCEFVGNRLGWTWAAFITVKSDRDGIPVEVMFVTKCIDKEKKKEELLIKTSNTDALTNLLNRRAYETTLNSTVLSDDLVYIAFDVNGLKNVNDTLGHMAGDEMLIGAANCIQKSFGKYGNAYRIGGDEFVAIIQLSMNELEEAKHEFESFVCNWSGKLVNTLHIAVGYSIAAQDIDYDSLQQMSILADKRMYADKAAYYRQKGIDRRKY